MGCLGVRRRFSDRLHETRARGGSGGPVSVRCACLIGTCSIRTRVFDAVWIGTRVVGAGPIGRGPLERPETPGDQVGRSVGKKDECSDRNGDCEHRGGSPRYARKHGDDPIHECSVGGPHESDGHHAQG